MEFVRVALSPLLMRLVPVVEGAIVDSYNVKKDLEDIIKNLKTINCGLEKAEKRALRDESVRLWMKDLRAVKYKMEDLIDDYAYERGRLANAPFYKKPKRLLLNAMIACRIKDIKGEIDNIKKRKDNFHFENAEVDQKKIEMNEQALPTSYNAVGEKIEKDTKELTKLIMKEGNKEEGFSIIAITGMPGVGKTTLAHKVYSHLKEMTRSFDIICWVPVTKGFDEKTLLKRILESMDLDGYKDVDSKVKLSTMLEDFLKNDNNPKKFFIVLDDIWRGDIFDKLLNPSLRHGAPGSKILITTRDADIARRMRASHVLSVEPLIESDALTLLYCNVFSNGFEKDIDQDKKFLNDIAIKIVLKCGCLPLAIKMIGGVLRTKEKRENEWEKVLNSDLWMLDDLEDSVMAPLYLSYIDMSPIYRECFMYLSLFPNKYMFFELSIVPFWIAEGLIEEDKCEECFQTLVRRNFLQKEANWENGYVMHDIVHSFIRKLTEEEHVYKEGDKLENQNGHRYSISNAMIPASNMLKSDKNLRSLMLFNCSQVTHIPDKDVLKKLRHLRVLYLKGTGIKVLPDYITKLVQLRLLDLSGTNIKLLPKYIGRLSNLEHLNLEECKELDSLPESLTKLKNLHSLYTDVNAIKYVPKGLDSLTKLEGLRCYAEIQELGPLINLKYLCIQDTKGIDVLEAEKVKLNEKSKLRELGFNFRPYNENVDKNTNAEMQVKVLEALYPPPCLETLIFRGFSGTLMPSWLSSSCSNILRNLIRLELDRLERCHQLPELGQLPNLQRFDVLSAHCVERIGLEFFYKDGRWQIDSQPFRKLKSFTLEKMKVLKDCQWTMDASASDNKKKEETTAMPFPRLEELFVEECPALVSLWDCLHAATALTKLVISDCFCLEVVPELPAVKWLIVLNCQRIKEAGPLPLLETVRYEDKLPMERLPLWLGRLRSVEAPSAPSLQKLYMEIGDNYLIRRLCPTDIWLDWPLIQNIPIVSVIVNYGPHRGDFFEYAKSPFLYRARILKQCFHSEKADDLQLDPIDFTEYSDGIKQRPDSKDTKQCASDGTRHANRPGEIVPATYIDLIGLINGVSTEGAVTWDGFYADPTELPFNFHSHLEVITKYGEKQVLCIDQPYSSDQTGFTPIAGKEIHAHLPHTTTGESSMACFSTRHSLGNIYDTVNGQHGMTKLQSFHDSKSLRLESLKGFKLYDAKAAKLKQKVNLKSLFMCCTSLADYYNPSERQDIKTQELILEALCPPPSIRKLSFGFPYGPQLPSWLSSSYHGCLQNLMVLQLICLPCIQLQQLGELPNLQRLEMFAISCVRSIRHEPHDRGMGWEMGTRSFRKLKILKMEGKNEVEECQWMNSIRGCDSQDEEGAATPLENLEAKECPKLIFLHGCLHAAVSLTSLEIGDCFEVEVIPELPMVKLLIFHDCLSIKRAGPFPYLEKIFWEESYGAVRSLPIWLGCLCSGEAPSAPSLKCLYMNIGDSYLIRRLYQVDIGLDWPLIKGIPIVEVKVTSGSSNGDFFIYTKSPFLNEARVRYQKLPGRDLKKNYDTGCTTADFRVSPRNRRYFSSSLSSTKHMSDTNCIDPGKDHLQCKIKIKKRQDCKNYATLPCEIVPATLLDLAKLLERELTVPIYYSDIGFYPDSPELPLNFHNHLEVITGDGKTRVLCIDHSYSSVQTGFLSLDHTHLPYNTSGEAGVACFSTRGAFHDSESAH